MKLSPLYRIAAVFVLAGGIVASAKANYRSDDAPTQTTIFDAAVFYTGYITDRIIDEDLDDGIVRFNNYHYTRRLDLEKDLPGGDKFSLDVIVGAICDNYDRMGRVLLAFPEAGSETYNPETTERIEIARFITPFMDRNRIPNEVPYFFEMDDISRILKDGDILSGRDVWMEVELFGMSYSANAQVRGCLGRNDIFEATVNITKAPEVIEVIDDKCDWQKRMPSGGNIAVVPITVSRPEIHGNVNFNRYTPGATDTLGITTKTYRFNVENDLADSRINLILTNHGAEEDGEEYQRREHLVYVDGELKLVYTPGGVSCEPYRIYSTQANGLFGTSRPDEFWEEISNWCPGQAVPVRRIPTGALKAGEHTLMIRVPEAEFIGDDGDFRPSAWLMGVKEGTVAEDSGVDAVNAAMIEILVAGGKVFFSGEERVTEARLYSYDGRLIEGTYRPEAGMSLESLPEGAYIVVAFGESGRSVWKKIIY